MKRGDPVTVAVFFSGGRLCAAITQVESVFELAPRPGFRWNAATVLCADGVTTTITDPHDCFFDDEGTTWLRGWQSGEAAVAMLAAASLDVGAVPEHTFDHDYSSAGRHYDFDGYLDDNHPIYKEASWRAR